MSLAKQTLGLIKKSTWSEIKNLYNTKKIPMDYIEHAKYYQVFVIWNTTKFTTNIFKPNFREIIGKSDTNDTDYDDFINNFKHKIDLDPPDSNPINISGVGKKGKKLLIHESSRPDTQEKEYTTCWTGSGDDIVNHIIWGDSPAIFDVKTGTGKMVKDVKFDPMFGDTWIHEGYGMWENAGNGDYFSVSVIADAAPLQTVSNLDLVIEQDNRIRFSSSGAGTGTHGWAGTPAPIPNSNKSGWWDIDENGNLIPNTNQTGGYDIYTVEKVAGVFLNKIPVMGTTYNYTMLQSADSTKVVYPYFLRIEVFNNSNTDWKLWFFMTVYRERTV